MDPIKKYPIHKVVRIEDFSLVSVDPDYTYRDVFYHPNNGGIINLEVRRIENQMIRITLMYAPSSAFAKVRIKMSLRLVNESDRNSRDYEMYKEVNGFTYFIRQNMELAELVNEENGWLIDGALVLEYAACVEAAQDRDQIWMFNFWDPVFDQDNRTDVVTFTHAEYKVYSLKHMLAFHSPKLFLNMPTDRNSIIHFTYHYERFPYFLKLTLQAAHGVRVIERSEYSMKLMIQKARMLQLYNVVHYCQYRLIVIKELLPIADELKFAFEFNTRHYSIHLMKKLKSRRELKEILEEMDIQKMSGESMKQCARFIFDGKI